MTLLLAYLFLALGLSFMCSMLESVLLSVPRSHVEVLRQRGTKAGLRLSKMKDDVDAPLAAILTLNTFAHTLGAAGVGAQAAAIWGDAWVGLVGFIVTILVLVFSEIIPKTLGAVHAKALAGPASAVTQTLIVLLHPVVFLANKISKLFTAGHASGQMLSREEIRSMASMAHSEGAIDRDESELIHNLIALRERTVEQVMTPRTVVFTLQARSTVRDLLERELPSFSRIPVVDSSLDDARGFIHRGAVLRAIAEGRLDTPLERLARPLRAVPEGASLRAAMDAFIASREHILLVVDEYGGGAGVVTLEDIMETLLGVEIVDETDRVVDMQALAREMLAARETPDAAPRDA